MKFSKDQEVVTMRWEEFCEKIQSARNEGHHDGCAYSDEYIDRMQRYDDWLQSVTYTQTLLREKDASKYE